MPDLHQESINLERWCKAMYEDLESYLKKERPGWDKPRLEVIKWTLRMLANPKVAGSGMVLDYILKQRELAR